MPESIPYNYEEFLLDYVKYWLQFGKGPVIGDLCPDFELHTLDKTTRLLSSYWKKASLTIIEFGSLT